jgi:hypothetical protein
VLSPHDLFHGHLISYGPSGQEHIAVIFHAKEYPRDQEVVKNHYQIEHESFLSYEFSERNFIYLSDDLHNEILAIDDQGVCHNYFADQESNTLSEEKIRKGLPNGKRLGDVNMFEAEKLRRIKYQFYPGYDSVSGDFIIDYEGIETNKSFAERNLANLLMEIFIAYAPEPLVYFLTGRE